MIGDVLRLDAAGRIAEMVGQLAAEGALHDRFLEATDGGIELLRRERALTHKLVENLGRDGGQRRLRRQALSFPGRHRLSSCYASHTEFLTLSPSVLWA